MKFYTHGQYDKVKSKMCLDFTKYKTEVCGSRMKSLIKTRGIDKINKDENKRMHAQVENVLRISKLEKKELEIDTRREWYYIVTEVRLKKGESVTFRYRTLIADKNITKAELDLMQSKFAKEVK